MKLNGDHSFHLDLPDHSVSGKEREHSCFVILYQAPDVNRKFDCYGPNDPNPHILLVLLNPDNCK